MTTNINTQQVITQGIIGVMSVSIMASAMGVMMGAVGASAYKTPASELKGTAAAVRDLRLAFGGLIVDQAVKNVGTDSMLALAKEVERLIIEDMRKKYGEAATDSALKAAVPGDIQSAQAIAATLSGRGYGRGTFEIPGVVVQQAEASAKKRVKQKAKPVKDKKTGIEYKSKSAAGMAVAAEYGLNANDTYVWYEVIKKDPNRFVAL
jgi:hypothetical protein